MTEHRIMTRRDFLRGGVILGATALCPLCLRRRAYAAEQFVLGINYPWIAYGHDYGSNGWGHDGLSTSGWTFQTSTDSQGFTDVRHCTKQVHNGKSSLCITADLVGKNPNKSKGEVYIDLRNHPPTGATIPLNLENITVECWVYLPPESAGDPSAPNGIQILLKSEGWHSFYSKWQNIERKWEGKWVPIVLDPTEQPGYKDTEFDPTKVISIGLKVAINPNSSTKALKGLIYLDDFVLDTDPPLTFNFEQLEVDRDFILLQDVLRQCPTRVIRVFVFADGRAAPDFTASGKVSGFDKFFFRDFDVLVRVAQQRGQLLIPVLLDFHWCDKPKIVNGVQLGGHSAIIRNSSKRQTFFDRALEPFLVRYSNHPSIYAIDIINEPEWAMKEIPDPYKVEDPVSNADMQEFVRMCGEKIHAHNSTLKVTVGSARRKWLHYWKGLGLDVYQFHWYDKFICEEPFPWRPYSELGLDKPCIIGEVPADRTQFSMEEYLKAASEGGYHGLLVWSYRAGDKFSDFSHAEPALRQWCAIPP